MLQKSLRFTKTNNISAKHAANAELENSIQNIFSQRDEFSESARVAMVFLRLLSESFGDSVVGHRFSAPLCSSPLAEFPGLEVLNTFGLRKVPLRAQRALVCWHAKKYQIVRLDFIPTAWQLLQMQALGKRCITMDLKPGFLDRDFEGKNFYNFLLHDLIHADNFFRDENQHQTQKGFYRFILELAENGLLDFRHEERFQEEFEKEFAYLISDMNSHACHLFLTFQSIIDRFFRDPTIANFWWKSALSDQPEILKCLVDRVRNEKFALEVQNLFLYKAAENLSFHFS